MRILAMSWGIIGIFVFIGYALYRLFWVFMESLKYDFFWYHWLLLVVNIIFMAYSEGYKGFQKKFSPRVAARVKSLQNRPQWIRIILAPVFCMGYFHATKKTQITTICLTLGIIFLILIIRNLTQPWRGIIDAGVVVGLAWGLISLGIFLFQAFTQENFPYDAEIPSNT